MSTHDAMQRALALAERGRGWVEPNPMVGAVLVHQGRILGEGWHHRLGGPHAEIEALGDCRARGHDPAGATMVVTLEPCCHHGRTGPCTRALIEAKVARVVAAMADPSSHAAGKGFETLRKAGVEVEVGLGEDHARRLNQPFLKRLAIGLPWVIAKWAQTLDGKIATATGDSQWISNAQSRRRVHELRARVDAVMVGVGTVLADRPRLTARDVEMRRAAKRVIVDPRLRTPPDTPMLVDDGPSVIIACGEPADAAARHHLEQAGAEVVILPWRSEDRLDLACLLRHLSQVHEATNVLAEGGAALLGSLFDQRLVDQCLVFVAPRLMGDPQAMDPITAGPCASIADALRLELGRVEPIGEDVLLEYRIPPD